MPYASSSTAAITAPHRKNAALRNPSESPYQQRTTQKDNPTQQLIKQAVDYLLQQLEAGKSETLTAYLAAMARFHSYSFGNILAIARQRPTASRVAGFSTWKELGRFVKRGEKGIQILAPIVGHRRTKNDQEQQTDEKPRPVLIGFRAVYVFDVAQTEGADLPEFEHNITGDVRDHRDRLIEFLARQNIALDYTENIAPALGVSYGGRIALLPGQTRAEEFVTLVHEVAHELLHKTDRRTKTTAQFGPVRDIRVSADIQPHRSTIANKRRIQKPLYCSACAQTNCLTMLRLKPAGSEIAGSSMAAISAGTTRSQ